MTFRFDRKDFCQVKFLKEMIESDPEKKLKITDLNHN